MSKGVQHSSPPVWKRDIPPIDESVALSFRDLSEIRAIDVFLRAGVSWKTVRRAEELGRELLSTSHPFSTNRIRTDGQKLFAQIYENDREPALFNLVSSQRVFLSFISPFLKSIAFSEDGVPLQWWPYKESRDIVIDPKRSFGQPIVCTEGVPTRILSSAFNTMHSIDKVANWYGVNSVTVEVAVAYEKTLKAA